MQVINNGEGGGTVRGKLNSNFAIAAGKQDGNAGLTAIASIVANNDDFIQRKGNTWVNRSILQVQADLFVNAAADGATKGVAAFHSNDFNASAGIISIDYVNGQTASSSQNGFLSSGDWISFNSKASLASPAFTGTPTAPTAAGGTNTNQIATTAFVAAAISGLNFVSSSRTISTSLPLSGGGDLSSNRTLSISDAVADGSTKGAAAFNSSDFNSASGVISIDYTNGQSASSSNKGFLTSADWTTFNGKASLSSPSFSGTPTAPTAGAGTNTGQIATTAFVRGEITALGTLVTAARTISTTGPLAGGGDLSSNRTLSIADAAADGSTKGAAAFNSNDFNSASGVISIDYTNGQTASGSQKGFLTSSDWTTFNNKASLSSPSFSGTPTAPTAAINTNTTQLATTEFVNRLYAPRVQSVTSAASVTPTATNDLVTITAQAEPLTLNNPTGTWAEGQALTIRIEDNNVAARGISYGANYRPISFSLPPSTVQGKLSYLFFIYHAIDDRFDLVGYSVES